VAEKLGQIGDSSHKDDSGKNREPDGGNIQTLDKMKHCSAAARKWRISAGNVAVFIDNDIPRADEPRQQNSLPENTGSVLIGSVDDKRNGEAMVFELLDEIASCKGTPVDGVVGFGNRIGGSQGGDVITISLFSNPSEKSGEQIVRHEADGENSIPHNSTFGRLANLTSAHF